LISIAKSNTMDTTFLPHANSLLIDYFHAVLQSDDCYAVSNLNAQPPGYTIYFAMDHENSYRAKRVTQSGDQGFILHYLDFMTPRPFDRENLKVTFLLPRFSGFEIFEISQAHTVLVLRVADNFLELNLHEDTPIARVTWERPSE
jgi:hypothetical protein